MNTVPPRAPQGKTFIYALVDPETGEVRYIGKTNNPSYRLRQHLNESEAETHKGRWIKKLKSRNMQPLLHTIEEVSVDEWQERERYWIDFYREQGTPLTNEAPGGIGIKVHTPEILAKIAASKRGNKYPKIAAARKGKPLSPESIAKRSASVRARTEKRRSPSPETIEKLRQANIGKSPSAEARAKISASHKGRVKSPEECRHISEGKKGTKRPPVSEETSKKLSAASKGRKYPPRSPEFRKKISDAQRGQKRGPYSAERRANITAGIRRFRAMKKLPPDAPTLWD